MISRSALSYLARPFRSGAIVAVLAEARTLLSAEFPKFVALWHGW